MLRILLVLLLGCLAIPDAVLADSLPAGCDTFSWNLKQELALFAGKEATPATAGADAKAAPVIHPGKRYEVRLIDQARAHFDHAPGKTRLADAAHGGLLALRLAKAGKYRITIDQGSWVDVTDAGALINANQFQGRTACPLFHKSVEYTLPAGRRLLIQLSGETGAMVGLVVTPVR